MKKSNLVILSVLMIGGSCTKAPKEKTLLSHWEAQAPKKEVVLERALASTVQKQCLQQVFTVDTLKAEIQEIERKFNKAGRVRGTWRHLNLDDLPVPQANFLKEYGDQIGDLKDDSIDYNGCSSVPCIYNRIYGKEGHIAGYVHYLWYLKFGYMLSADNLIPIVDGETSSPGIYNNQRVPLDQYLYNDQELYGLWRLTLMLKAPQTSLKKLKEFQRVPRGHEFEGTKYKGACGLAYSRGWIKVTDSCLWQNKTNLDMGYLYQAVTHEINHHVDFEGGENSKIFYRSHQSDYATVAGFNMDNEYVDQWGRVTREWGKTTGQKLVTSYAGTSPQENFAESLAMFRIDGDLTKSKITGPHFDWVSQNYYQNRSFEREALLKHWIDGYALDISNEVLNAVTDCNTVKASPKSSYFKTTDFSSPVLPTMLNCLGTRAVDIAKIIEAKIAIGEPEGCTALYESPGKEKWPVIVKASLASSFDKFLSELQKDPEYLARIQEFRSQLNDKRIAKNAYVNCYEEFDELGCFTAEVQKNAYAKAEALRLPPEQTQELADLYVAQHSFHSIKEETMNSYRDLVASKLESIREEAQYTWEACAARSHNNSATPRSGLFDVGSGFMVSSFYNCLNNELPGAIQNTVRNFTVGSSQLTNGKEELILTKEVQPRLIKYVQTIYESERNKEVSAAIDYMYEDKGKLRSEVLSSFQWATNLIDSKQLVLDCKKEALRLIGMELLFNEKKGIFSDFLEKQTCAKISESPEVNKWIENSKGEFIEKVVKGLEVKMLAAGHRQAQVCIDKNPNIPLIGAFIYKKKRESCLRDAWDGLEASVVKEIMTDPIVKKLNLSSSELTSRLARKRMELQDEVIRENFNPSYSLPKIDF